MEPWYINALQPADAALLVVDLSDPACMDQITSIREQLAVKKIDLEEQWPGFRQGAVPQTPQAAHTSEAIVDPFRVHLPTLLIANKADLDPDPTEVEVLEELLDVHFPALAVSSQTGQNLDRIGRLLFDGLEIVRVYTKAPGRPADRDRPFTVRRGRTVLDVARLVHKDIARTFQFARIWGSGVFDGQQVGADHPVEDQDVVELHM
jgi:ribosome-interacting GTPase 1